jgi:hypothetical protein
MIDRATGRLADGMAEAADILLEVCRTAASDPARVSAARALIELGAKLKEMNEFEARLASLEEAVREQVARQQNEGEA